MATRRCAAPVAGGFGFPLGCVAGVPVTLVFGALGHQGWALLAFGVVAAAVAGITTVPAALGTAATLWAMDTGFVIGNFGQLTVHRASEQAAGVLFGATVLTLGVAAAVRAIRAPRRFPLLLLHQQVG